MFDHQRITALYCFCIFIFIALISTGTLLVTAQSSEPNSFISKPLDADQVVEKPAYDTTSLIVKYREPVANLLRQGDYQRLSADVQLLHTRWRAVAFEPLMPVVDPDLFVKNRKLPRVDHIFRVEFAAHQDIRVIQKGFEKDPNVVYAELNRVMEAQGAPSAPIDEFYNANDMWGLFNVSAELAWNTSTGTGVVVAVVDSGVDLVHPDLAGNIFINSAEIPNNFIDDDNNGYIDDRNGWDFVRNDNDPSDVQGHGTHVAGTIAAISNNSGVVGLAYNAQLMPVRGLGDYGSGFTDNLAQGIIYAASNGADIINNSWGGFGREQVTQDAIDFAHGLGVLVISAAGNSNYESCYFTPANIENSMTIAAAMRDDTPSGFTNYGVKIDVTAPSGPVRQPADYVSTESVLSTSPAASTLINQGYANRFGNDGARYNPLSGTSMSSPHVAALAALIKSQRPTWTPDQIAQVIRLTADDVGTGGFDETSGFGRINAASAVAFGNTPPPSAAISLPLNCETVSGIVSINGRALSPTFQSFDISIGAGRTPTTFTPLLTRFDQVNDNPLAGWDTTAFPDGEHTIRLRVTNAQGITSEDRNLVTINNIFITDPTTFEVIPAAETNYFVRGQVTESVNPSGPQLTSYSLSYQGAGETTFTTFSTSTSTVFPENVLGVWNVTNVPDGEATLRLTANYNNGTTVVEEVAVVVDQLLMSGWPREAADPDYPVYKSPKVADLDGNGVNEIVLGHAVFQADGSVRPGWTSEPGFERPNSAVVDLDGDNRLEVVAVYSGTGPSENYGAPMIRAYNADGFLDAQGQLDWSHAVNNPASSPSLNFGIISSVVAGNVDADPQPEIVYSIYFVYDNPNQDTTLVVLDGASGFVQNQFTVTGISYSTPALADLDNDGVAEIVLPSWRDFDDVNFVHAVNADGTTVAGWPYSFSQQFNIATLTGDPVIGDVDLDGDLEILIGQHLISHTGVSFSADWPVSYIARSTGALAPLSGECESNPILGGGNAVVFWITDLNGSITGHRNKDGEDLNIFYFGGNGDQGTPSVGDVDGNGVLDVLRPPELGWVDGRPSRLYAGSGETAGSVASFPRYVRESNALIRSTATITDLDQDGDTEVLIASSGEIYVWDFPGNYNPNMMPWPMFQHDLQNTGNMGSYYKPSCIAPTAATVSAMQAGVEPSLLVVSLSVAVLLAGVTLGVRRRYQ